MCALTSASRRTSIPLVAEVVLCDLVMTEQQLPGRGGILIEGYGAAHFAEEAGRRFPELIAGFKSEAESLHFVVATLGRAIQTSLETEELERPMEMCEFLASALRHSNAIS